ncbi:hypothetical protein WJX72_007575 [[Myrmecia] bisecta]|uniref:Zinc/iron permease n=1 Tax=[Myrmecia] bisecta TaxID=41462 RepID=A0AAW1Q7U9_9CHLO
MLSALGFSEEEKYALLLSTLAGLSTSIGGAIAIIRRPGDGLLAFLLGLAIGVMVTLSVAEMFIRNALEHGVLSVSTSVAVGAGLYYFAQPYLPDFDHSKDQEASNALRMVEREETGEESSVAKASSANTQQTRKLQLRKASDPPATGAVGLSTQPGSPRKASSVSSSPVPSPIRSPLRQDQLQAAAVKASRATRVRSAELLRLGLLMAFSMTLHNIPEGFAVAFSAFTDFGPVMALAIAVHNIPEGVIVAAPVFAATGSRWKAMGISVASGLSEPFGAFLALLFVKPFLTPLRLQYMLAFVGGIMMAVCGLELWPEARKWTSVQVQKGY